MKRILIPTIILFAAIVLFACTGGGGAGPYASAAGGGPGGNQQTCNGRSIGSDLTNEQAYLQCVTGMYMAQTHTGNWFPLSSVHGPTAEMANDAAREVRLNDPNRIGYFYGLSTTGQVMAFYTIRGKVSSTGSQLTNTENAVGYADHTLGQTVVSSAGDDGTYGPEECQGQGVFFFTADTDALVEWCGPWQWADAPLKLSTTPIITESAAPTTPVPVGGSTKK